MSAGLGWDMHPAEIMRAEEMVRWDPGKHPRDPRGRWSHTGGGKLPWRVEGNIAHYQGGLGIDRADMPQLSGTDAAGRYRPSSEMVPQFIDHLRGRGITVAHDRVNPADLRPTQTTGDIRVINAIAGDLRSGKLADTKPVTISADGRLLDGHHNWAGRLLANTQSGAATGMPVVRVGLPMPQLLAEANRFGQSVGLRRRATGQVANPAYGGVARGALPAADSPFGGTGGGWVGGGAEAAEPRPAVSPGLTWDGVESVLLVGAELGRAFSPRELRGPHGRWAKAPGGRPAEVPAAAVSPEQIGVMQGLARAEARVAALEQAQKLSQDQAAEMHHMYTEMRRVSAQLRQEMVSQADLQKRERALEQREQKRRRTKLAVHMGMIVAGLVVSGVEAKLGTPDLVAVASGGAPLAVQELADWAKGL